MFPFYSEEADKLEEGAEYDRQNLQSKEKSVLNEVTEEYSEEEDSESLESFPYFHGEITRDEAELRLKEENIGTFLVRFKTSP